VRVNDPESVRKRVSKDYSRLVTATSAAACCPVKKPANPAAEVAGYSPGELDPLSQGVAVSSFGCGNPVAFGDIAEGETVLDLGSGAGLDLILAARKVGPSGRVIGIDMTEEMISRARENVAAAGLGNVEVRKGIIEELPVESSTVDWVISNCVINLSPEKGRVFAEIARVLRPGGRMVVSDIVVEDLPDWVREKQSLYSGCIAGAIGEDAYQRGLLEAGLAEVEVRDRLVYDAAQLKAFLQLEITGASQTDPCSCGGFLTGELLGRAAELLAGKVWSALFSARKAL
jgi:SAM-dependent methyltransferase